MAEGFLAWELLVLGERFRRIEERVRRRQLRDAQNPFELPRNKFIYKFRVSPELVLDLTDQLRDMLVRQRRTGLSPEIQVLAALRFYAKGSYQDCIGDNDCIVISQPTVSRCVHAVTDAINVRLLRREIQFPMTPAQRQEARTKFANAPQSFEGAIGAIDCTYIHILGPPHHEEAYVNHHGNHSLNVQAIVDPGLKVLNINARWPGARNDAHIWSESPIRRVMELYYYERNERRTWLIGDAGYPLEPWLMTPMANYPADSRQFNYTKALCKARNVVERFFGVLKGTWRCLSYQRVLLYDPGFAGRIVNACAILHNMRLRYRLPAEQFHEDDPDVGEPNQVDFGEGLPAIPQEGGPRALGERVRNQIMRERYGEYRDVNNQRAA